MAIYIYILYLINCIYLQSILPFIYRYDFFMFFLTSSDGVVGGNWSIGANAIHRLSLDLRPVYRLLYGLLLPVIIVLESRVLNDLQYCLTKSSVDCVVALSSYD